MKSIVFLSANVGMAVLGEAAVNPDVLRAGDAQTIAPVLELTTVLDGPGAMIPTSATGNGGASTVTMSSITCRPVTSQVCEVIHITSTVPGVEKTSVMSTVTSAMTESVSASKTPQVTHISTGEFSAGSSTIKEQTSSATSTGIVSSATPTSGGVQHENIASGLIAGLALLFLI